MARSELSSRQRAELDRAIRRAETLCRAEISVFVGRLPGESRDLAQRMHAVLAAPDASVLLAVDPRGRTVEIVTGASVRARLTDAKARKVVTQLGATFAQGDRAGGLVAAVDALAAHAAR